MRVVGLLGRTSERGTGPTRGAEALAEALGRRLGASVVAVGEPGEPRTAGYVEDLRDGAGALRAAAGAVEGALGDGVPPVLCAGECSIAVATLPVIARRRPEAVVLWLDAHGDFNTPDTSGSGYLGGMCLAGACGLWDTGFGAGVDPARVVFAGVRDLDTAEGELVRSHGIAIATPAQAADEVAGRPVFVHLDLDVLDPSVLPATQVPTPGGITFAELGEALGRVAERSEIVGVEVTALDASEDPGATRALADAAAVAAAPLLAPRGGGS